MGYYHELVPPDDNPVTIRLTDQEYQALRQYARDSNRRVTVVVEGWVLAMLRRHKYLQPDT